MTSIKTLDYRPVTKESTKAEAPITSMKLIELVNHHLPNELNKVAKLWAPSYKKYHLWYNGLLNDKLTSFGLISYVHSQIKSLLNQWFWV